VDSRPDSVLFIVPARAGSKGVPNKNLRRLGERTLIWHAVECSLNVPCRSGDTVVTTDIEGYRDDRVFTLIQRPPELAQDDTPMIDVVKHVLGQIPGPDDQIIVLLQPTAVFRTPAHVRNAIGLLREKQADSVVSVVELPATHHPDFQCIIQLGHLLPYPDPAGTYYIGGRWLQWMAKRWASRPTRRQDIPYQTYTRDGTVYAFWRKTVATYDTIYGSTVCPMIVPAEESCTLDSEADWREVERRWQERL
jgi:CMP-N,N'-diacetyllegionaminic acid synthase